MNTDEIKLFLALSRTLHFQKASSICNMSPSAFSRAISRIEDEAGKKLFERSNRSVSLTPSGAIFKEYAEKMLKIWNDGKEALSNGEGILSGELSIYCSVTAAYGILPEILDGFRHHYPGIHIRLRTGDAESALEHLKQGETDISIAAIPSAMPPYIVYSKVVTTQIVWIKSKKSKITTDWYNTPLILPKQGIARKRFNKWNRKMKAKPEIYAEVAGNEAIIAMVHLGCGIGLVPELVLEKSPVADSISVIDSNPPLEPIEIGICVSKKKLATPIVSAFWEVAQGFTKEER